MLHALHLLQFHYIYIYAASDLRTVSLSSCYDASPLFKVPDSTCTLSHILPFLCILSAALTSMKSHLERESAADTFFFCYRKHESVFFFIFCYPSIFFFEVALSQGGGRISPRRPCDSSPSSLTVLFDCLSPAVRQTDNASMKNSLASFLSSCAAFCLGEQGE